MNTCVLTMVGSFSKTLNSYVEIYAKPLWEAVQKSVSSTHFKETIQCKRQLVACSEYQNSHQDGCLILACLLESVM